MISKVEKGRIHALLKASLRFLLIFIILSSMTMSPVRGDVTWVEVHPAEPVQGDQVSILIKADPGEEAAVKISFNHQIQVSNGLYEYKLDKVFIPSKPNSFTVRATGVENLHISVKILFWITKSTQAENGVATLSQRGVPKGIYDIRIRGDAAKGADTVHLQMTASTKVVTDQDGFYEYSYDTGILPPGNFTIKVGDETETFKLNPATPPGPLTPEELRAMMDEEAAEVIQELSTEGAAELLTQLDPEKAANILQHLEADSMADLLLEMAKPPRTPATVAAIIEHMSTEEALNTVRSWISHGALHETGAVLNHLTTETLNSFSTGLTTTELEALQPHLSEETWIRLGELSSQRLPDLTVAFRSAPQEFEKGEEYCIEVDLFNIGEADAGPFLLTLEVDDMEVDSDEIQQLARGSSTTWKLYWTPTKIGGHRLRVAVDRLNQVSEGDEGNNSENLTVEVKNRQYTWTFLGGALMVLAGLTLFYILRKKRG